MLSVKISKHIGITKTGIDVNTQIKINLQNPFVKNK